MLLDYTLNTRVSTRDNVNEIPLPYRVSALSRVSLFNIPAFAVARNDVPTFLRLAGREGDYQSRGKKIYSDDGRKLSKQRGKSEIRGRRKSICRPANFSASTRNARNVNCLSLGLKFTLRARNLQKRRK